MPTVRDCNSTRKLVIRSGEPGDALFIWQCMSDIAKIEGRPSAIRTTPQEIAREMQTANPSFGCLVGSYERRPVCMALYERTYSTWQGRPRLQLEDIYVASDWRGKGVGVLLFEELAKKARESGCSCIVWEMADTNFSAGEFYWKMKAEIIRDRTFWRFPL